MRDLIKMVEIEVIKKRVQDFCNKIGITFYEEDFDLDKWNNDLEDLSGDITSLLQDIEEYNEQ